MIAANGAPALRLARLSVAYEARVALQDVSLEVDRGEFVALTGPNGSGKSTLLRACLGLVEPSHGVAELFGTPVGRLPIRERAHRVAWVPQSEGLREDVPLERYVLYGRYAAHGPLGRETGEDAARLAAALEEVGLADRSREGVLSLSGGERQRAVLARALCQGTPLLLLDEPTTHLDIGHQLDLLARVRALVRGRGLTAVAALHDLNLAARFADRVVVLSRGRLVADGAPASVLSSELLARVWGVDAELRRDAASGVPYLLPRLAPALPGPAGPGPRVHVVAGGGSGSELLRRLVNDGFDVTAGVLPLFDTDAAVAQELGVPTVVELPFVPIGPDAVQRLDRLIGEAAAVVVAPFPVGPANLANLERTARAGREDRTVLLAQPAGARWDFTNGSASEARRRLLEHGAVELPGIDATLAWLRDRLPPASGPPTASGERREIDTERL